MMIWVTDAQALPDYRLRVCFSDGSEGDIDLKDFIESDPRPIAAPENSFSNATHAASVLGSA